VLKCNGVFLCAVFHMVVFCMCIKYVGNGFAMIYKLCLHRHEYNCISECSAVIKYETKNVNLSKNASCFNTESSEQAIAKMKNLDESKPVPVKHKDVNTFKNNQVKFTGGAGSIPPEHMKCNILKARLEEDMKKG